VETEAADTVDTYFLPTDVEAYRKDIIVHCLWSWRLPVL